MTFEENFERLKNIFMEADLNKLHEDLAFQINLTGDGAGTFYAEYKGGKLSVEPYDYHDRDAALTADSEVFYKIAQGKLDPIQAFFKGSLKVDGNVTKALELKNLVKVK